MIAIVDYGAGNLTSVANALAYLKIEAVVTAEPKTLQKADKIYLPGVGRFAATMQALDSLGLTEPLKAEIARGKPYLGVCLGLQILFEQSREDPDTPGLGILKGGVRRFAGKLKIPQIGWNSVSFKNKNALFDGIPDASYFYFVHSYYVAPKEKDIVLCTTTYGTTFCSGAAKGNIFAVQFHPERSGKSGLQLIRNFAEKC